MGFFSFLFGKKKKDEQAQEPEVSTKQGAEGSADDAPIADELEIQSDRAEQGDNEAVFGEEGEGAGNRSNESIADQVEVAEKKGNSCDTCKEKGTEPKSGTSSVAAEVEPQTEGKAAGEQGAAAKSLEQAERERQAAAEAEAARIVAEKAEQERLAAEQAERERQAAAEAARIAAEKAEQERLAAEQAERERQAAAEAEAARIAAEKAEQERLAAEQAERERQAAAEAARIAAEKAEQERLAAEQAERERQAAAEAEAARIAAEKAEQERLAAEAEAARIAAEKAEQERLAAEAEAARIAAEKAEQERLAAEQAERERQAAEAEATSIAAEKAEQERLAAEAAQIAAAAEAAQQAAAQASAALAAASEVGDAAETAAPASEVATKAKRYFFDVVTEEGEVLAERLSYEKAMGFVTEIAKKNRGKVTFSNNVSRTQLNSKRIDLQASVANRRSNIIKGVIDEEVIKYKNKSGEFTVFVRWRMDDDGSSGTTSTPTQAFDTEVTDTLDVSSPELLDAEQTSEAVEPAPVEAAPAEAHEKEKKLSFFARLKRTRDNLAAGLSALVLGRKIDEDLYEELETALLSADLGVETTNYVIERLRNESRAIELKDASALRQNLHNILCELLEPCEKPLEIPADQDGPFVILMVGVNGAGKTTTIGKLAQKFLDQGKSVMLAAGDTFRAAAVEQLKAWGERVNVPVVAQDQGSDSASVLFDALKSAKARKVDVLICDTAGRLQNKENLMEELKKIVRVMQKQDAAVPHETLLVLDAATGQNAVSQTKLFTATVPVTGLVLTKLDGTAKGGIVFALADKYKIPIRFIGVGEKAEDLRVFQADPFVEALLHTED